MTREGGGEMEELDSVKAAAASYRKWAVDEFIDHGDVTTLASFTTQTADPKREENESDFAASVLGNVLLGIAKALFGVTLAWALVQLITE